MDFVILKVNGTDVSQRSQDEALEAFRQAKEPISVELIRCSSGACATSSPPNTVTSDVTRVDVTSSKPALNDGKVACEDSSRCSVLTSLGATNGHEADEQHSKKDVPISNITPILETSVKAPDSIIQGLHWTPTVSELPVRGSPKRFSSRTKRRRSKAKKSAGKDSDFGDNFKSSRLENSGCPNVVEEFLESTKDNPCYSTSDTSGTAQAERLPPGVDEPTRLPCSCSDTNYTQPEVQSENCPTFLTSAFFLEATKDQLVADDSQIVIKRDDVAMNSAAVSTQTDDIDERHLDPETDVAESAVTGAEICDYNCRLCCNYSDNPGEWEHALPTSSHLESYSRDSVNQTQEPDFSLDAVPDGGDSAAGAGIDANGDEEGDEYYNAVADLYDVEYEEVVFDRSCLKDDRLGIQLISIKRSMPIVEDIYINEVEPNSLADKCGRIRRGDQVLQVNGLEPQTKDEVVALIKDTRFPRVALLLARPVLQDFHSDTPMSDCFDMSCSSFTFTPMSPLNQYSKEADINSRSSLNQQSTGHSSVATTIPNGNADDSADPDDWTMAEINEKMERIRIQCQMILEDCPTLEGQLEEQEKQRNTEADHNSHTKSFLCNRFNIPTSSPRIVPKMGTRCDPASDQSNGAHGSCVANSESKSPKMTSSINGGCSVIRDTGANRCSTGNNVPVLDTSTSAYSTMHDSPLVADFASQTTPKVHSPMKPSPEKQTTSKLKNGRSHARPSTAPGSLEQHQGKTNRNLNSTSRDVILTPDIPGERHTKPYASGSATYGIENDNKKLNLSQKRFGRQQQRQIGRRKSRSDLEKIRDGNDEPRRECNSEEDSVTNGDVTMTSSVAPEDSASLSELYAKYVQVMYTNGANLAHTISVQQKLFEQQLVEQQQLSEHQRQQKQLSEQLHQLSFRPQLDNNTKPYEPHPIRVIYQENDRQHFRELSVDGPAYDHTFENISPIRPVRTDYDLHSMTNKASEQRLNQHPSDTPISFTTSTDMHLRNQFNDAYIPDRVSFGYIDESSTPTNSYRLHGETSGTSGRKEWIVKLRPDGTRYITRRTPRLFTQSDQPQMRYNRPSSGNHRHVSTDDETHCSDVKLGRYWSRQERKKHAEKSRERREAMRRQRLSEGRQPSKGTDRGQELIEMSRKRSERGINRKSHAVFDDFVTLQEMLAHGSRDVLSSGGLNRRRTYNPLLSVTTV